MYTKILVPVVFEHDPAPEQSIEVAKSLLKPDGSLTLLHILEELPAYVEAQLPTEVKNRLVASKNAKDELSKLAEKVGGEIECEVIHGNPASSILDYGNANGNDCIIIASHKPGLADYLMGSTASRVVRHAKCAVHVLR